TQATLRATGSRPSRPVASPPPASTPSAASVVPGVARLPASPAPPVSAQTTPAVPRSHLAATGRLGRDNAAPRPVANATPSATQGTASRDAPRAPGSTTAAAARGGSTAAST